MTRQLTTEIHFYQQDEAAVFFESNTVGDEEAQGELLLFSLFAIRQLCNLGKCELSDVLATTLAFSVEFVSGVAAGHEAPVPRLILYPGNPGRKRFLTQLVMTDSGIRFDLKPRGFGLFGAGLGYYAPASVSVLQRFFAERRRTAQNYIFALGRVGQLCGTAYHQNRIGLAGQNALAMEITTTALSALNDRPTG